MNARSVAALAIVALFSVPLAAGAATTTTTTPMHAKRLTKPSKIVNNKIPGSPGYTNSSPLGSAQKSKKRAAKKASM
jgi:hypothetical protein